MTDDQKHVPGTAIRKESKPPAGDPWADDVLGSKRIAEKLTNAVEDAAKVDVDNAYVIGFHGEWGTGKTFLLERWCEELKSKEDSPCVAVYYNAWEDDFLANPLVAIIARLLKTTRETEGFHDVVEKYVVPMAKAVSKIIHACSGVDAAETMSSIKGKMDKIGNVDEVNRYLDLRKETDALKGNLRGVAEVVKKETGFPLVFVIDELDRCRPVFALEVLERVKHLFDVPNVVFVLGMNKAGLQESIEKVYGYDDIQSEKYLRRFFDREVSMPFSSPEIYCDHLLNTSGLVSYFEKIPSSMREWNLVERFLVPMTGFWGLTLREVEGLVGLLLVVINKENRTGKFRESWICLALCLIFLKVKNPALYTRIKAEQSSCKDLINEMIEMFCDEESANPQHHGCFDFCQDIVEEKIYLIAGENEWKSIREQLKSIRHVKKPYPNCPALAKRTMKSESHRVEMLCDLYRGPEGLRASVKDITSLIEFNDAK